MARKPVAVVTPCEAFKILAAGFRYNPYRLALLRRIYVGRFSHSEVSCPSRPRITFNVPGPPPRPSSQRP
jgi:hypothetical protein